MIIFKHQFLISTIIDGSGRRLRQKKINNIFIIYISNIDFPSQKLFYRNNKSLAEIDWAKLQAIFHQPYEIQNDVMQDNNNTHYDFSYPMQKRIKILLSDHW